MAGRLKISDEFNKRMRFVYRVDTVPEH